MNKRLLISKNVNECNIRLDYYIVEDRYIDISNNISTYVYGVEIQQVNGKNPDRIQKRTIHDISCSDKIIEKFIHYLCENEVTPVQLYDVVSEKVDGD